MILLATIIWSIGAVYALVELGLLAEFTWTLSLAIFFFAYTVAVVVSETIKHFLDMKSYLLYISSHQKALVTFFTNLTEGEKSE